MKIISKEESLMEKNPDLAKEWSYEDNTLTPRDVFPNSGRKVWWICSKGHKWQAVISNRNRGIGCPVCANKRAWAGYNDLATVNPETALEWDYERNEGLKPQDVRPGTHKKVWWKCSRCGNQWQASVHGRTSGKTGCPKCSKELQSSFPEQAIFYYLKKYFPDAVNSDITAIGMELDIFIPSEKIAIEYDGEKWHKGNTANEIKKNNLCKDNGILLIRVREGGLEEYDDCAICFIRKNRQSTTDLTQTIEKILVSISHKIIPDVDVERDSKEIYGQYISREKTRSLQELYPEVAAEWHPSKNGIITPEKVRAKSRQKVWWMCSLGHEWKSTIGDRVAGTGCPYCAGRKILVGFNDLATTAPKLSKEWNYERNASLIPQNVNKGSNKKIWWICSEGHEWQATIYSRSSGDGCPFCSGHRSIQGINDLATVNPELVREWDYERNSPLTPKDVGKGSYYKVWWQCSEGHKWKTTIRDRVAKGYGCPVCSGRQVLAGYNDLATKNPVLASEWNYEKNSFTPQEVTSWSGKRVWWKCVHGHEWQSIISSRNKGDGCPICSNRQLLVGYNDLTTTNPELAAEWHPNKNGRLTPEQVTSSSSKRVYWLGKCGHEWQAMISNRSLRGNGCPVCAHKLAGIKRTTPKKGIDDLATNNPALASEWHPDKNGTLTPGKVKVSSTKRVWWYGNCGHEWQAKITDRNKGGGCPICARKSTSIKRLTPKKNINDLMSVNPELAAEWHPTKNGELKPDQVKAFSGNKVWWLGKCGHEWQAVIRNRGKGAGCPICSGRQALSGYNDLETINPSLAKEWHPFRNGNLTPGQVTPGSNKEVWWLCSKGHEWQAKVNDRNNGNGCAVCANQKVLAGYNDLATLNHVLAAEWHPTKNEDLTPEQVAPFSSKKVWWLCKCGHEWQAKVASRSIGSGCPYCFKIKKRQKNIDKKN